MPPLARASKRTLTPWPFASRRGGAQRRPVEIREGLVTRRDAVFRRLLILADVTAAGLTTLVLGSAPPGGPHAASFLLVALIVSLAKLTGRYDHDQVVLRKSTLDEMPQLVALTAISTVSWTLLAGESSSLAGTTVGSAWLAMTAALMSARAAARLVAAHLAPAERVLIIGDAGARAQLAARMACDPFARTDVVGFLPFTEEPPPVRLRHADRRRRPRTLGDLQDTVARLGPERVLLVPGRDESVTRDGIARVNALGLKLSICPSLLDLVGCAVELDEVGGLAVLSQRSPGLSRSSKFVKRASDIAISSLALMVAAPLLLLIGLLIKADSSGPVFFRQRRIGRAGRAFMLFKFRTMVDGADRQREALRHQNETDGLFKIAADPRVTRVGRWLRRASLDEFPQLINVLRGEMSLVGPRPLVPDEDQLVQGHDRVRLDLAPGVTGPWQVLGPRRPPLSDMVKIDYLYALDWSLWNDIKIMVRTAMHMSGLRGL